MIRNVGIMAHIDAGKTTTTERMLYYAGYTRFMGEVDHGDTVMDYMTQERDRGITIVSAAITFLWKNCRVNLIDTPGHVDFTLEVERALRVLDGSVTILDASAGVEAQTLTVWHQAERYKLPRILYLNKMDKHNADYLMCLTSIEEKLHIVPLLLHLPVFSQKHFKGVIDLVSMEACLWDANSDTDGETFVRKPVTKASGTIFNKATSARNTLVEAVADLDDAVAELLLAVEDPMKIPSDEIKQGIRRITLHRMGAPVLLGSSFKKKCVQLLMNAVVDYLPSPLDRSYNFEELYGDNLCAFAFKIIHDRQKGALSYLRVYNGCLKSNNNIFNINQNCSEHINKVYEAYSNEYKDVPFITEGNIAVVTGLRNTITGDMLTVSAAVAKNVHKLSENYQKDACAMTPMSVPDPVFFCTIEPASLAHQKGLDFALEQLQKEDPSLKVTFDEETGQTVLSGMGELHIDIIKDRIQKEYKVECDLGPLQVTYRETIEEKVQKSLTLERTLGGVHHNAILTMSVTPSPSKGSIKSIRLHHTKDNQLDSIKRHHLKAIETGTISACLHGPLLGFKIVDIEIGLHDATIAPHTSVAMVTACAAQCVTEALRQAKIQLLEPMMSLEISTSEKYLHGIMADLSRRRSQIVQILSRGDFRILHAKAPLAELLGYSTALRTISSGNATFSIELSNYEGLPEVELQKAYEKITGFAYV